MKEKQHRDATRPSIQQAVIFDLDETLLDRKGSLDIYAGCLWSSFEANANLDKRDFLRTFHDLDGNGRVPRPAFFAGMSRVAFTGVSPPEIATHFNSTAWLKPILFPGALNIVKAFKSNGYAIGVVTNGSSLSQNSKIANSGLSPYLDAFVISEEFGSKKPDPAIYEEIVRRLQIHPAASWFVGDDPICDVVGPAKFGFATAWIARHIPWPKGQAVCYKRRIKHVSELADALLGHA